MAAPALPIPYSVLLQPSGSPLYEHRSAPFSSLCLCWSLSLELSSLRYLYGFLLHFLQVSAQISLCRRAFCKHPVRKITSAISIPLTCSIPLPDMISACLLSPPLDVTEETLLHSLLYPQYLSQCLAHGKGSGNTC